MIRMPKMVIGVRVTSGALVYIVSPADDLLLSSEYGRHGVPGLQLGARRAVRSNHMQDSFSVQTTCKYEIASVQFYALKGQLRVYERWLTPHHSASL